MSKLEEIKKECMQLKNNVNEAYVKLNKEIIFRDITELQKINSFITYEGENRFSYKKELVMTINSNGNLEIENKHGIAFLWLFEILYDEELCLNNYFEFYNKIYCVDELKENEITDPMLEVVRTVINEYNASIRILKSYNLSEIRNYKYYDNKQSITCNTLQDIFEIVLKRKN